jgi:hypothetical protein
VWLTREESNLATPKHVAHFQKLGFSLETKVGDCLYGGPVRCAVFLERHNKKLVRWAEFLRTTDIVSDGQYKTGLDVLRAYEVQCYPEALAQWWIYLGTIPQHKIYIELTRSQGIEACNGEMERLQKRPETAGAFEAFKKQRDVFAAADPNAIFLLHDGECQMLEMEDNAT